ncbi:MAG: helix-turn-helix domain-containing protein [Chitinophagia bacterium]|nr:helix-turn-helix domain-containing protein [Chitinophagia bacterium]
MTRVCILVPHYGVPAAVCDPHYLFTAINRFLEQRGEAPLFEVLLVGMRTRMPLNNGMVTIATDKLPEELRQANLILVPAIGGDLKETIEANARLMDWVKYMHLKGAEVASLCTGAFLLASTGLLNGRECSTHWQFADSFRNMFPRVTLVEGQVITGKNGLYSSGGASSYWNLLLYLAEKYAGREMAVLAAKFFAIDMTRATQTHFMVFQGQKMHNDAAIQAAQDHMETHYHDKITVDDLARKALTGRRTFERRFKSATHNTVVEYLQRVRIEAAKNSFEHSGKTVQEVMYEVGYSDIKSFRDIFRKLTGLTPFEYKGRYQKLPEDIRL